MPETPAREQDQEKKPRELEEKDLETVAGGTPAKAGYATTMQMLSNILGMLNDTRKKIIGNIR